MSEKKKILIELEEEDFLAINHTASAVGKKRSKILRMLVKLVSSLDKDFVIVAYDHETVKTLSSDLNLLDCKEHASMKFDFSLTFDSESGVVAGGNITESKKIGSAAHD